MLCFLKLPEWLMSYVVYLFEESLHGFVVNSAFIKNLFQTVNAPSLLYNQIFTLHSSFFSSIRQQYRMKKRYFSRSYLLNSPSFSNVDYKERRRSLIWSYVTFRANSLARDLLPFLEEYFYNIWRAYVNWMSKYPKDWQSEVLHVSPSFYFSEESRPKYPSNGLSSSILKFWLEYSMRMATTLSGYWNYTNLLQTYSLSANLLKMVAKGVIPVLLRQLIACMMKLSGIVLAQLIAFMTKLVDTNLMVLGPSIMNYFM